MGLALHLRDVCVCALKKIVGLYCADRNEKWQKTDKIECDGTLALCSYSTLFALSSKSLCKVKVKLLS